MHFPIENGLNLIFVFSEENWRLQHIATLCCNRSLGTSSELLTATVSLRANNVTAVLAANELLTCNCFVTLLLSHHSSYATDNYETYGRVTDDVRCRKR